MPKPEFDYYYGAEAEQFSFVKVPKVLFSDKEHFGCLSNDAIRIGKRKFIRREKFFEWLAEQERTDRD